MTVMRKLNNKRMQELAMQAYEEIGEAIAPEDGATFEESVENVIAKQIALGMAMSGNLSALLESEMLSKESHKRYAALNMELTKGMHRDILVSLGLKEVTEEEYNAGIAESSEGQVVH